MSRVLSNRLNVSPYAVFTAERQGEVLSIGESFAYGNGGGNISSDNTRLNWGPGMPYPGVVVGVSFFSSYNFVDNPDDQYNSNSTPASSGGTSFTFKKTAGGNGVTSLTSQGEINPSNGTYLGYPSFSVNNCTATASPFEGCTFYYNNMNLDAAVINFAANDVIFYTYTGAIDLPLGTYIMSLMVRFYPDPQFDLDEF